MPYSEQDFDRFFEQFNSIGQGSSIKELYNMMPFLNDEQIAIVNDALYFTEKWNLPFVNSYIERFLDAKKRNRSLGFFPSFKQFLKYMTLEEKFKGYKMQGNMGSDD